MGYSFKAGTITCSRWIFGLIVPLAFGCALKGDPSKQLKTGIWRGTLEIQGKLLPFNFEINQSQPKNYSILLYNGSEKITVDDVRLVGDSLMITMPFYDSQIRARLTKNRLNGTWIKRHAAGYVIPFKASFGDQKRFYQSDSTHEDISGTWRVKFSKDSLDAVGEFVQQGSSLSGTFLTSKGDYRYLQGAVTPDSMFLSTFDGAHAFLFEAEIKDANTIQGIFHSGPTWEETWVATRDSLARLADPDSLTYLNPGYEKLSFAFPDLNGKTVTLDDPKYQNKVVIVQIFGTWCPNCIDETKFLAPWYDRNRNLGVEIIGLAYERIDDFSYARKRINKMVQKLDVKYDFLVAGISDKAEASKTLPMLNYIMSFPTTIFIDHNGVIRRIHTGFSGPGTGVHYQQFVDDFELFTNKLITERLADTTLVNPANPVDPVNQ